MSHLLTTGIFNQRAAEASLDADLQAWLDRGTTLGYTLPSAGQQTKLNTLVLALKAGSVWSKLQCFYAFAIDGNNDMATLNMIAPTLHQITRVNSPTFTGTPRAPTPAVGDNTTKVATTAFGM